jgi:hypothetical protein
LAFVTIHQDEFLTKTDKNKLDENKLDENELDENELDEGQNQSILSDNSFMEDSEDDENENNSKDYSDDFIFENSSIKISQFNLLLTLFISRFSLSKKCSKELLKLIVYLLPKPSK